MKRKAFKFCLIELINERSIDGNPIPQMIQEMQELFGETGGPDGVNFYKFNNWQCFVDKERKIEYISLKSVSDWNKEDEIKLADKSEFLHNIKEKQLSTFLDKNNIKWDYVSWTDDSQATIEINSELQIIMCREKDGIDSIFIYNK